MLGLGSRYGWGGCVKEHPIWPSQTLKRINERLVKQATNI